MCYSVDGIEDGLAALVSESGELKHVSLSLLAEGVKSGDMVYWQDGLYRADGAATEQRKNEVNDLLNRLLGPKE
ncbi:MAG: DUF3006 domain-containing protein [Oscillospiraceae bacterium]